MTTTVQPFREWLLLRRDPEAEKIGNILIPTQARERTTTGTVVAAGSLVDSRIHSGVRVLYSQRAGHDIKINDEGGFTLLLAEEVMAVVDGVS